jgi:ferredoxin
MTTLQVRILHAACCGNAACVEALPQVFALDSKQKAVVLDAEGASLELLIDAAEACPCQAIVVEDDEGLVFP